MISTHDLERLHNLVRQLVDKNNQIKDELVTIKADVRELARHLEDAIGENSCLEN